jgi:hypothetical protein
LKFDETARQADLVIVGQRTNYSPKEKNHRGGPDVAKIRVLQVLKGTDPGPAIKADAWYGMCPWGMAVDDQHYVMFLKRGYKLFHTIENGCAVKTLPVKDDMVELEGKRISLSDFRRLLMDDGRLRFEKSEIENAGRNVNGKDDSILKLHGMVS